MKTMLSMVIGIISLVFVAPVYAACTLSEDYWGEPFATVMRYAPGKTKVLEKWECTIEAYPGNSGVCFLNALDNEGNHRTICFSGEYRIEYAVNYDPF